MIDTSEEVFIVTLTDKEKSLLKKIMEIFLQNQWKPSQDNFNFEMEDRKILQSMHVSSKELLLTQLEAGPEGYGCHGCCA